MSATGRNLEGHERNAVDFYETPGWCTRAILPHLSDASRRWDGAPKTILDAGSGTGAIARECHAFFKDADVVGVESEEVLYENARLIKTKRLEFLLGDFFECGTQGKYDLVIANPPYGNAEKFAAHALEIGVTVAFLLRINWLASKKRSAFHRAHPADLYVLPKRPSFTHGGTDATEYAWFVWGPRPGLPGQNPIERGNRWFLLDVEP